MAVEIFPSTFSLPQSAECYGKADSLNAHSNVYRSNSSKQAASGVSSQRPSLVSSMSIMKEAVCFMGIPDDIVQLAIDIQRQKHQKDFTAVTQLLLAADEIFSSPKEKHVFEGRHQEAETTENAKEQQTDKITVKAENDNSCISEVHTSHVAEMQKVAEAKPVTADKCKLQEKVKKLARENQRLKQRKFCRACKEVELATSGVTFLPCGHFITCETCSEKFDDCPACGKSIMGTVRTFLS